MSYIDGRGYVRLYRPDHPNAYSGGEIFEHRLVMSEHLNRPLVSGENVHHINGDKEDNRLENLRLFASASKHAKYEGRGGKKPKIKLPISEIIRRYQEGEGMPEIARTLGVGTNTIARRLKGAGISLRSNSNAQKIYQKRHGAHRRIDLPMDEIAKLHKLGQSSREIARKFGVDKKTILDRLTKIF